MAELDIASIDYCDLLSFLRRRKIKNAIFQFILLTISLKPFKTIYYHDSLLHRDIIHYLNDRHHLDNKNLIAIYHSFNISKIIKELDPKLSSGDDGNDYWFPV